MKRLQIGFEGRITGHGWLFGRLIRAEHTRITPIDVPLLEPQLAAAPMLVPVLDGRPTRIALAGVLELNGVTFARIV